MVSKFTCLAHAMQAQLNWQAWKLEMGERKFVSKSFFVMYPNGKRIIDYEFKLKRAAIFSHVLRDSTSRYVGWSVGCSVGRLAGPLLTWVFRNRVNV